MIRAWFCLCLIASLARASPVMTEEAVCTLCLDAFRDVHAAVLDERVHAAVVGRLEGVCDVVGPQRIEECSNVLSGLTQDLLRRLLQDMRPTGVCAAMTACPAHMEVRTQHVERNIEQKQQQQHMTQEGEDACELCEALVKALDALLKNKITPAEANATIYKLCESLSSQSMRDMCISFAPGMEAMLINGVDPTGACTNIGICMTMPESKRLPVNMKPTEFPLEGPACELCEMLVQAVDRYLQENKTEAAINTTVYKLCNALPTSVKPTCLSMAPVIVTTLTSGVDPKVTCTFLKLCTTDTIQSSFHHTKRPFTGPACELCELLVQAVDQYLKESKTEAAINATVYKLCNALPDTFKTMCLSMAPNIVTTLTNGLDPKVACTFLKLCGSTEILVSPPSLKDLSLSPACELCELLVQTVDRYLQENKTEAAINATVYKLCNVLPASVKTMCLLMAPAIVSTLSKGMDPKEACTFLRLCAATDINRSDMNLDETMPEDLACAACLLLAQTIDQYLQENSTEAAINATLYKLCSDLPSPLKEGCLDLVPQVVIALSLGLDPDHACDFLRLCVSSASQSSSGMVEVPTSHTVQKDADKVMPQKIHVDWCRVCKDHIGIIDQDLYREEPAVQHLLDDICHRFPPPTDQACLKGADYEFPHIWEIFLNGTASAENVCKLLKVCTN